MKNSALAFASSVAELRRVDGLFPLDFGLRPADFRITRPASHHTFAEYMLTVQ
jgi:hypothetical protein